MRWGQQKENKESYYNMVQFPSFLVMVEHGFNVIGFIWFC
jgi:hypothetical protein